MKRGSNASEVKPAKKPKTNTDITSKLLLNIQQTLAKQLSTGKMMINPIKKSLPKRTNMEALLSSNPEEYFETIQFNLKALRSNIDDQRRAEKQEQKIRLHKAQELIDRMRKQKEQYHIKLKQQSQQQILHRRLYSDTTLQKMREKIEERITNKRMQIEERVKAIEERKMKRDEEVASKEVQYWEYRKELKQKSKSSVKLPTINHIHEGNPQKEYPIIPRKNSMGVLSKPQQYERQANRLMRLAKMKQENISLKKIEEDYSNRLQSIKGNQNLNERLYAQPSFKSNNQFIPNTPPLPIFPLLPHSDRQKLMGNEFLKQSLLLIKKNNSSSHNTSFVDQPAKDIQLTAHEVHINKNAQIQALKEKWIRILSKIRHNEITKEQGLQLLNNIEKRLDKMDISGVNQRLKQKYEVLSGELPLNYSLSVIETQDQQQSK